MKMKLKYCSKCKKRKPFFEFHKNKARNDGLCRWCKKCRKKYDKLHRIVHLKYQKMYCRTLVGNLRRRFGQIKQRCNNPKYKGYKNYGGRGIKCLFKNADEFIDCVINKLKVNPCGLHIDRIDNNGHYEPDNIRFVTQAENNRNKRKCLND